MYTECKIDIIILLIGNSISTINCSWPSTTTSRLLEFLNIVVNSFSIWNACVDVFMHNLTRSMTVCKVELICSVGGLELPSLSKKTSTILLP